MIVDDIGYWIERALTWIGISSAPPVAPANSGRIYFDIPTGKYKVSQNGGPYVDLVYTGGLTPDTITLTAGENIVAGEFVRISATNTVIKAIATSATNAGVIGFADSSVASGNPGTFRTRHGTKFTVQFETGLALSAGAPVYLSLTTAGAVTNVGPSTPGDIYKFLGIVVDATSYVGGTPLNSKADIIYIPETTIVVV